MRLVKSCNFDIKDTYFILLIQSSKAFILIKDLRHLHENIFTGPILLTLLCQQIK